MKYVCDVCGWEYDEELGDPDNGIEPGTKFEDLTENFVTESGCRDISAVTEPRTDV